MPDKSKCLILFAKEPVSGQVKTRLEPFLGKEGALALYQQLLSRQISLVNDYPFVQRILCVDGDIRHQSFNSFTGFFSEQQGENIGERMAGAMQDALSKMDYAVLIGCDCPEISADYIDKAFTALDAGYDAVFGPAVDGGYVLVGLHVVKEGIFQGIEWGTEKVMAQTRQRMLSLALKWKELEILHDIDEPEDLKYLDRAGFSF